MGYPHKWSAISYGSS